MKDQRGGEDQHYFELIPISINQVVIPELNG